ncbi:hypothetical protein Pen01_68180 [Phytomonospora endophytica]|nr:hypothetical protein Pen01_68180 [Phytomonospora endophytica]
MTVLLRPDAHDQAVVVIDDVPDQQVHQLRAARGSREPQQQRPVAEVGQGHDREVGVDEGGRPPGGVLYEGVVAPVLHERKAKSWFKAAQARHNLGT